MKNALFSNRESNKGVFVAPQLRIRHFKINFAVKCRYMKDNRMLEVIFTPINIFILALQRVLE